MYEDPCSATASWSSKTDPLISSISIWYLNSGFGKRLHRATNRPFLPERLDNYPNRVLGLWIVVIPTVRALNPSDGQLRNDLALSRFGQSRLRHEFGSFTVFKV